MKQSLLNSIGKVHLTIEYDPESSCIYNNWIGYQSQANIMAGLQASIKLLRQHESCCMLNDNRQVVGSWDDSVDWIIRHLLPQAPTYGLVHFAHIVRPESLAAYTAEMLYVSLNSEVDMRIFHDLNQAKAWLHTARLADSETPRETLGLLRGSHTNRSIRKTPGK